MVMNVVIGAIIASIAWFIVAGILYMNPYSEKIFNKEAKKSPAVKKWTAKNRNMMIAEMYFLGVLIPSIIFAFVYYLIQPALPGTLAANALLFGLLLMGIKTIPRFADMKMMTEYPKKLLTMDFIVGSVNCFVVSFVLAMII
ncbi:MAG: hypothetical protein KKE20_05070 [Nanoarchaeota archaeon]|nr:hypothetical protein [Nanoarchaeota archaeon]